MQTRWLGLGIVAISSLAVTGLILSLRELQGLQALELTAYDRLVQSRPDLPPDPRLLVVAITDEDIEKQGTWPIPDQALADLLERLQTYQPRAIGLDFWRNLPTQKGKTESIPSGYQALLDQLRGSDRMIVITTLGNQDRIDIPPPPGVPEDQVGFNDVVTDPSSVIRRNLMFQDDYRPSFSLRLALRYLQDDGIEPEGSPNDPKLLKLGPTTFPLLQSRDGGYMGIDTGGYQILLNYRAGQNIVQQVSLTQVLEGRIRPDWVRDRVILIGTTAESGKDLFLTPYSSGARDEQRMPGVVIHAQMVSQFLDAASGDRPLIEFWSEPLEMAWIFCWGVLGALLAWVIRQPLALALGGAVAIALLYSLCWSLFLQSQWVPLVPPFLALLAAGGSVVTYRAQQAHQQQQMVMRLLGQSASPEIAETLWQRRHELLEDGKLSGQKLTSTLLFTDLKGFSTISERLDPEALLVWLNEYLEVVTQLVQAHHGVINKFTGDGVMAVFGVPIAHDLWAEIARDAQNAVNCALAMGEQLQALNTQWHQQGLPAVQMRVGIFTGEVVVGSLGSKARLEYGVIGDSVNTASRLESVDKHRQPTPCRILIGQETLDHLEDRYEVESWGALPLKGKEERVETYRVLGLKPPITVSPSSNSSLS